MKRRFLHVYRGFKGYHLKLTNVLTSQGISEYTFLIIFSVILGTVAGLAAVGFHQFVELITHLFFGQHKLSIIKFKYIIILVPVIGMFVQWIMVKTAPRQAKQRGVLEIIKSVSLRNGDISFKTTLFHFLAPAICIGTGGTVGPEAPAAQSGAGAVSAVGKLLGLSESRLRIFTAAGAGAAIAGVFNTPLAGIFFAIEVVLLNDLKASALSAFLLSSVSASAVSRMFLGNEIKFHISPLELGPYSHFVFYLLLGVGAGLLSIAFIKANEYGTVKFQQLYKRISPLTGMLVVGLLMGLAGFIRPEIFGIGYKGINDILSHSYTPGYVIELLVLKFVLVILILRSGGFGGIFAPSIFMGACYGYLFAFGLSHIFQVPLDTTAYTLVGMGALLAGVNSVPITAILILFEMTNNYHFILPLMLGIVGSNSVAHLALNGSIYLRELRHAGYQYASGHETRVLRSMLVEEVTRLKILTVSEATPLSEVVRRFLEENHDTMYTINKEGHITGQITSSTLRHVLAEYENLQDVLVAKDIADPNVIHIDANENLEHAMKVFARQRVEELPVVYQDKTTQILGTLHYQDILNAYNQNVAKLSLVDGLASEFKTLQVEEVQEVIPGFSLAEVDLPEKFIGKTIIQARLRNRYKIDILMVLSQKTTFDSGDSEPKRYMPDKDLILSRGNRLIIYGRTLDVISFKKLSEKI